jgi:hypothetical protein
MIRWLVLAAYVLGWLLAIRPAMRRRMLQKVCDRCGRNATCQCGTWGRGQWVVRGAEYERTGGDVAAAVWFALWWPLWLAWRVVALLARLFGSGVMAAVDRATPLTTPELERRLREQDAEIKRLTSEMGSP